ncbi:SCO family protein [Brevibacillus sp. SYSU BS000544]|uniref:SCO family protein n=1 Tax=Brevibacillus sp. SYSU BS000544 TaxID=3416443 RepID=UPI003CE4FC4D
MHSLFRSIAASVGITLLGATLFWFGTDGFQAFTAEAARQLQIEKQPQNLPAVWLEDSSGKTFQLQDYAGKIVLLTFMYTGCAQTCTIVESNFRDVYKSIPTKFLGKEVNLISISFDQEHDTPSVLKRYGDYYQADGVTWRMARVLHKQEQAQLLQSFDVTVIPDENGGYEHNSAFYLVDRQNRLVKIFDYTDPQTFVDTILPLLGRGSS